MVAPLIVKQVRVRLAQRVGATAVMLLHVLCHPSLATIITLGHVAKVQTALILNPATKTETTLLGCASFAGPSELFYEKIVLSRSRLLICKKGGFLDESFHAG